MTKCKDCGFIIACEKCSKEMALKYNIKMDVNK